MVYEKKLKTINNLTGGLTRLENALAHAHKQKEHAINKVDFLIIEIDKLKSLLNNTRKEMKDALNADPDLK